MTRYRLFGRGTGQGEGNLSWIRNNLSSAIQLLSMAQPAPFFFFFSSYLALPYLCLPRLLLHPSPPTHPHRIILLPWFRNLVAPRFHHSAVRAVADLTTPDDFSAQPGKALHAHSRELSTPSLPLQLIMSVASYPAALGVDGWQSPKTCNGCGALPVPGDESLECQNCTRANFYTERAKPPSPPPSVADSACSLCSKHLAQCDGDKPRCASTTAPPANYSYAADFDQALTVATTRLTRSTCAKATGMTSTRSFRPPWSLIATSSRACAAFTIFW
ncbi:hypothetical protein JOL62DRAFT_174690 [Phyllosticta paracitricarpa]|uniref:Uncharacterized protein n=1 Tax=Phyllosticta paracitricarpa TaxID=2016321 RepID=A0ABR1N600_9PEZI